MPLKTACPKPTREPREPFDRDEWQRRGAANYAATRREKAERGEVARLERSAEWNTPEAEKRRRQREKARREKQYAVASGFHRWTMDQPCAYCGSHDPELRSDPAHVGKTKGAGAKAEWTLSLCRFCHLFEGEHREEFNELYEEAKGEWPWETAFRNHEWYHREHSNRR